jgi:hypothetical protein
LIRKPHGIAFFVDPAGFTNFFPLSRMARFGGSLRFSIHLVLLKKNSQDHGIKCFAPVIMRPLSFILSPEGRGKNDRENRKGL